VAADLHELLATAGESGPYILVGHSAGGLHNRAFVSRYPSEVAGLVFVDSVHDQQRLRWPPEFVKLNNRASATYSLCKLTEPFGFVRLLKIVNMLFPGNTIPAEVRDADFSTTYRSGFCRAAADEVEAVFAAYDRAQAPASLGDLPLIVISRGISVDEEYAQLGAMQSAISIDAIREIVTQVRKLLFFEFFLRCCRQKTQGPQNDRKIK
jgi:pimeloyl-ACP methyl ester carboxylesterase